EHSRQTHYACKGQDEPAGQDRRRLLGAFPKNEPHQGIAAEAGKQREEEKNECRMLIFRRALVSDGEISEENGKAEKTGGSDTESHNRPPASDGLGGLLFHPDHGIMHWRFFLAASLLGVPGPVRQLCQDDACQELRHLTLPLAIGEATVRQR